MKRIGFLLMAGMCFFGVGLAWAASTFRISVSSGEAQGNGGCYAPSISADGRYVVFSSYSTNLTPGDTNGVVDVFLHDRQTGLTTCISTAPDGKPGDSFSDDGRISADGRRIVFHSRATNLVPEDTNNAWDIFVHDLIARKTVRVSVASDGTQANGGSEQPAISADGRSVAFESLASNLVNGDSNSSWDVFACELDAGLIERISVTSSRAQAKGSSGQAAISGDGRFVAFQSGAANLVKGDTNGYLDIFVRDRVEGVTERVSIPSGGGQANGASHHPAISGDGRYVAFTSEASNLVPGDTNGTQDIFIRDRLMGTTERISVAADGTQADGASDLVSLSADGRYVAFASLASNLVPDDTNGTWDVFLRDRQTGEIVRVSVAEDGREGNAASGVDGVALSADGRCVVFTSLASNLVPGDTNNRVDIFVYDRLIERFQSPNGFIKPGRNLVSVPADPLNPDPLAVFAGLDVPGSSFQYWDNLHGGYVAYGGEWRGPILRGTAYWFVYQGADRQIRFLGTPPASDFSLSLSSPPPAPYWILFGTPFPQKVPCSSIRIGEKPWADAAAAGMVDGAAWGWDAGTQGFFSAGIGPAASRSVLEPWYGYWLLIKTPDPLTITFPKP